MIVLFTDYGVRGPYVGALHAVCATEAPGVPVVDLLHTVPACNVRAGAYLLAAYGGHWFPPQTVFCCVVDPGVGGVRAALWIEADERHYVGPDNGLFELVLRHAGRKRVRQILWRPARLSPTFHGRDLFAPVAAMLARGGAPSAQPVLPLAESQDWPDDLEQVLYVDDFGNLLTGIRAAGILPTARLRIGPASLPHAATYSAAAQGSLFWYGNANGLVEIGVPGGRAADLLGAGVGTPVRMEPVPRPG